jgi:hypothetical protein
MAAAQLAVTLAALIAGTICFCLYVYGTVVGIRARAAALRVAPPAPAEPALQPRGVSIDEVGRLADALSKLTDSLSRASPALTSLIGALVFFAIAAVSSGALRS